VDLNCYYNYLLPALLNASVVMCLIRNPGLADFLSFGAPAAKGCFYIVVYFAIFSNLPASGILAAWAGSVVLLSLIAHGKVKQWKGIVPENGFPLLVLVAWFISAVFELSGGRAASAGGSTPLYYQLYLACKYLARILLDLNRLYQLAIVLIVATFSVCALTPRKKDASLPCPGLGVALIAAAAFGVYLLMLSSAVGPTAIRRSENLFGLFFFANLCAMLMLTALVSRYPKLMLALPLVTVFLLSGVDTRENTFLESNFAGVRPAVCADISRNLIEQLQTADAQGLTEVELHVPQYVSDPDTEDNWPHSLNLLERLPGTLYARHRRGRQRNEHKLSSSRTRNVRNTGLPQISSSPAFYFTGQAGTPTRVAPGVSQLFTTTAPAPTRMLSARVTPPIIFAPTPMSTFFPSTGAASDAPSLPMQA